MAGKRRRLVPSWPTASMLMLLGGLVHQASSFVSPLRRRIAAGAITSTTLQPRSYTVKVQDVEVLFDDDSSARERLRRTLADVLPHTCDPESALRQGRWFKLICGASYQDLPRIRTLALVYTLAGADCIDMSANDAVVTAAREGIEDGLLLAQALGHRLRRPWVMVSVNDQEDLHFRKASFDRTQCPPQCPRPCEAVCPTHAISFAPSAAGGGPLLSAAVAEGGQRVEGVVRPDRCYGCGRCLPVCPLGLISASSFLVDTAAVLSELRPHIDALEIHTNSTTSLAAVGQGSSGRGVADPFVDLWDRIHADASSLSLVSVSFPYMGEQGTPAFLRHRAALLAGAGTRLRVWQTDGRPMSGDIGRGATLSAVKFGESVLRSEALDWSGQGGDFVQLAGGTNAYTAAKLSEKGLLRHGGQGGLPPPPSAGAVSGLAFGGYARKVVAEVMEAWGVDDATLLQHPQALAEAVQAAAELVGGIKGAPLGQQRSAGSGAAEQDVPPPAAGAAAPSMFISWGNSTQQLATGR